MATGYGRIARPASKRRQGEALTCPPARFYPNEVGRNCDEILRTLKALQEHDRVKGIVLTYLLKRLLEINVELFLVVGNAVLIGNLGN